jgi:hypothetical protein
MPSRTCSALTNEFTQHSRWSRTTKQAACSSTDHGGGKRRTVIGGDPSTSHFNPLHGPYGTECAAPNAAAIQGAGATVDAGVIVRNVVEPPPARALASLVRVASSHPSRPSRKTASSVAQVRRAKMGIGHLQRFGTTMDLSQGWNSRRGRCRGRLRGLMIQSPSSLIADPRLRWYRQEPCASLCLLT